MGRGPGGLGFGGGVGVCRVQGHSLLLSCTPTLFPPPPLCSRLRCRSLPLLPLSSSSSHTFSSSSAIFPSSPSARFPVPGGGRSAPDEATQPGASPHRTRTRAPCGLTGARRRGGNRGALSGVQATVPIPVFMAAIPTIQGRRGHDLNAHSQTWSVHAKTHDSAFRKKLCHLLPRGQTLC